MQNIVSHNNDDKNKNSNSGSDNNSMPAQVQIHQVQSNMQQIHQPFHPHHSLSQLSQLQNWAHQQSSDLVSTVKIDPDGEQINKATSPTNISLESSSNGSSRIVGKRGSVSPTSSANFKTYPHINKGSGVDIKGPTPEVAQQLRFPWKLHLLLERCEYEHQQKLAAAADEGTNPGRIPDMPISWLPCGKAFKVHDKERFVNEVMPSFFGTQSFKTFQRNLNLWGFTRVSKGPQKDVCSHPLFLKGFPAVCQSMKRIVLKGTGRGNRAPLGGVDVSSVQAVVAAAAMQQAQQQQQQQQQAALNLSQGSRNSMVGGFSQIQAQQVLQQHQIESQHKKENDVVNSLSPRLSSQGNTFSHINLQNHQQNQGQQNQQQHKFVIENGSIHAAPLPSEQKLVVLPSASNPNASATTTVLWPNQQQQQQQAQQVQSQQLDPTDVNATLQQSLQQLSKIIQQLNGMNAISTAGVNNTLNNTGNNNTSFQPQQSVAPTPFPGVMQQQQQQQPVMMQQPQQQSTTFAVPNAVVAPSPMSTQDLVALLLQRNLQQQVSQVQQTPAPAPIQLQVPSSLFSSGSYSTTQPAPAVQQQQPVVVNNGSNLFAANTNNFTQSQQQQQGTNVIGSNSANIFSPQQQQQTQQVGATSASPVPQQQQNQLLQLLLQQNGWATSSAPI